MTLEQARRKLLSLIEPGRRKRAEQVKIINPRREGSRLSGTAIGSRGDRYSVWVDLVSLGDGCECWSHKKQACKHMAALLGLYDFSDERAAA